MKPPEPLTETDVERVFRLAIPEWMIERLDTRLGTDKVVTYIKWGGCGSYGGCTSIDGLPYPANSFHWDRTAKGFTVEVLHGDSVDERRVVRAGTVSWNRLANMTTFAALDLKHAKPRELAAGEQAVLF